MRKYLTLILLSVSCSYAFSDCYIGDSIAHGYRVQAKQQGITKVGASPVEVLKFVNRSSCSSPVILSSGISNNPTDFGTVREQLKSLQNKQVVLLGTSTTFPKYGDKLNVQLNKVCQEFKNCTFAGGFKSGVDGVHPSSYH